MKGMEANERGYKEHIAVVEPEKEQLEAEYNREVATTEKKIPELEAQLETFKGLVKNTHSGKG